MRPAPWWPPCRPSPRAPGRTPSPWRAPRWQVLGCRPCPRPISCPPGASTTPTRPACCPTPPRWRPGARASPRCAACPPWPCWCTATILWMAAPSGSMPGCAPSASKACSPMPPLASRSRRRPWPRCWSCPPKAAPARASGPVLVAAHGAEGRDFRLIERQAQAVAAKARRLIALQTKPAADKRLVAMVYNYPPGGTNFGASFLNVPRSLEQVSGGLAQAGYRTQQVPEQGWIDGLKPLLAAYYPGADVRALLQNDPALLG